MISSLLVLTLFASPAHAGLSPMESEAVESFIHSQSSTRIRGQDRPREYVEGRRIARGDLDGDGDAELVVLFTLEQGNGWTQFLSVFGAGSKPPASMRVGGKGNRRVELKQVADRRIELVTRVYGRADALCCPSIVGHSWFVLRGNSLEETDADIIVEKH